MNKDTTINAIKDIKNDLRGHFGGKGLLNLLDFVTGLIKLSDTQGYDEFSIELKNAAEEIKKAM